MGRYRVLIGLCIVSVMICCGCDGNNSEEKRAEAKVLENSRMAHIANAPILQVEPKDFRNGVYFFPIEEGFGKSLSDFIQKHSELEVVSTAPLTARDGVGEYLCGYWVIFREKNKK